MLFARTSTPVQAFRVMFDSQSRKRPQFKAMMDDALSGKLDIVAVHKLDRFSRNLRLTLEYFERLSKAGVTFLSISEQMDFSQPWGKFALAMLGGLAQFYSENLGLETKKGKAERKAQGLWPPPEPLLPRRVAGWEWGMAQGQARSGA